jgi:hypothetical protein
MTFCLEKTLDMTFTFSNKQPTESKAASRADATLALDRWIADYIILYPQWLASLRIRHATPCLECLNVTLRTHLRVYEKMSPSYSGSLWTWG